MSVINFETARNKLAQKKAVENEESKKTIFSYNEGVEAESFEKDTRGIRINGIQPALAFVTVNQDVLPDPFPPDFDPYTPRAA